MLGEERVSLDNYIEGVAHRPFAYRVLLPALLRISDHVAPTAVKRVSDEIAERTIGVAAEIYGNTISAGKNNKYPDAIVYLMIFQFLSLLGFGWMGGRLYSILYPTSQWHKWIPTLLLLHVPFFVAQGTGHIYDFTVLFFMVSLLWAISTRQQCLYLLLFTLSCLNKETTLLAAISWAAVFITELPLQRYLKLLTVQAIIYLSVELLVRSYFGQNFGTDMEISLQGQLSYYLALSANEQITLATVLIEVLILVFYRWKSHPTVLRRASIAIIPHLGLCAIGAAPGELRNFYESLPLLGMFVCRNLEVLWGQINASDKVPAVTKLRA